MEGSVGCADDVEADAPVHVDGSVGCADDVEADAPVHVDGWGWACHLVEGKALHEVGLQVVLGRPAQQLQRLGRVPGAYSRSLFSST